MQNLDANAIGLIMDNLNFGMVYVNTDEVIEFCNKKAKIDTGIIFSAGGAHDAGEISKGDVVIIADNRLGEDDGNLSAEDLKYININDNNIHESDMLVAVGVYQNQKIEPVYKHVREHQFSVPLTIDTNYYGFQIKATIDTEKRETVIQFQGINYRLPYFSSVGNMVVIDGVTGIVKFFQARGYSVRNEEIGKLLRGTSFKAKQMSSEDVEVAGKRYLDLFDDSKLYGAISDVLTGEKEQVKNVIYELNKRPFICSIVPWKYKSVMTGVFILLQEAENLEDLMSSRNEIIRQLEKQQGDLKIKQNDFPEEAMQCFIGKSPKAREVKYLAYKASKNKFNVIITGESGTGKSKIAREIHHLGDPKSPFVEVNCNAIAPSLFESELFGYVGGAFTGAKSDGKIGFFEAANGGTIFLDEIGEIPLEIQVKLLHVLQDKMIYRVGSSKPIKINVRVIAATNKDLEEEVAKGNFRQDLFYRINVFPINIPSLKERKPDLYLLINHIMKRECEEYGIEMKQFSGDALQKMISYNWPGNVRELENIIERAITLCDSNMIYEEHLRIGDDYVPKTMKEMLAAEEKRILEAAMVKHNNDKNAVMTELDISRTVLYDKLKKYNIG